MNYIEISREECSEALAKIITVLSEIILDPHENKTSVYPKAAEAFNGIADEVGFGGPRFNEVTFKLKKFDRDAAKLFYGVGDTTIWYDALLLGRRPDYRNRKEYSRSF